MTEVGGRWGRAYGGLGVGTQSLRHRGKGKPAPSLHSGGNLPREGWAEATPRSLTHLPEELPILFPQRLPAQTPQVKWGGRGGSRGHPIQGRVQRSSLGSLRLGVWSFLLT